MKKLILLSLFLSTALLAKIHTIVSIVPEATFLKAIGGEHVAVTVMVGIGASPHNYEPKPLQMIEVSKAKLYFSIGVEFEKVWLNKFLDLNPKMQTIDLSKGIQKVHATHHEHEEHGHNSHSCTAHTDPHIWTSPQNVKIIVQNIYEALSHYDPKHQAYYLHNLQLYLAKIDYTHTQITALLSELPKGRHFMVFHPSWGYFAQAYDLEQMAVEIEGKSPKPRELIALLQKAKAHKVSAIFTQAEFSDSVAKIIAKELSIPVIKVSPLAPQWSKNLIDIASALAGKH